MILRGWIIKTFYSTPERHAFRSVQKKYIMKRKILPLACFNLFADLIRVFCGSNACETARSSTRFQMINKMEVRNGLIIW